MAEAKLHSSETRVDVAPEVAAKIADKLEQLEPKDALQAMMIGFASRSTIGPDPETAAIFAQTERHAEEKRLEAYKENLNLRDKQSERDHLFRTQKQKDETWNVRLILLIAVVLGFVGVWLLAVRGQSALGSNFLVFAGGLIYMALSGKNPFEKS